MFEIRNWVYFSSFLIFLYFVDQGIKMRCEGEGEGEAKTKKVIIIQLNFSFCD